MPDSFLRLGPDGALRAVEAAGFAPTGHVVPLTCLENRVYDVRLEEGAPTPGSPAGPDADPDTGPEGTPPRHVVVKFYRPGRWSRQAILEEHRFLAELDAGEVPVCAPLGLADGESLTEQDGVFLAIWPRTGGRSPDELPDAVLPILGRLLARIHAIGAVVAAPHRPRFDAASRVHEPLAALESGGFLPPAFARRYSEAARAVAALYDERSPGVPVHRIHGDCHRGNLLERDGAWFFLDFDDFGIGPAVQDVWMLLPGRDAHAERQRRQLLAAYRELRDFDDAWLGLVEPLRALRFVWYAGWIARRWHDPVFPDAFPHFGSHEYWERETRDLEDQAAGIRRAAPEPSGPGAGASAGPDAEPELSNADYFWDL